MSSSQLPTVICAACFWVSGFTPKGLTADPAGLVVRRRSSPCGLGVPGLNSFKRMIFSVGEPWSLTGREQNCYVNAVVFAVKPNMFTNLQQKSRMIPVEECRIYNCCSHKRPTRQNYTSAQTRGWELNRSSEIVFWQSLKRKSVSPLDKRNTEHKLGPHTYSGASWMMNRGRFMPALASPQREDGTEQRGAFWQVVVV